MGKETEIAWTDSSWGAWWGCTKVSEACNNCYAETWAKRTGHPDLWGVNAGRRLFGPKHWREPLKWNREAAAAGVRRTVFLNSMADIFDNHEGVIEARSHVWELIRITPALTWLVLTKRIGNARFMLPKDWGGGYPNVWLGISVVNQPEAERDVPKLLKVPAAVHFLSVEPMLAAVDLSPFHKGACLTCGGAGEYIASGPTTTFPEDDDGMERCQDCGGDGRDEDNTGVEWVICGGESGPHARHMEMDWALSLHLECAAQGIPFFMKQLSEADTKGFKDFANVPEPLRVREWPQL